MLMSVTDTKFMLRFIIVDYIFRNNLRNKTYVVKNFM
jgi:hypothetical protein